MGRAVGVFDHERADLAVVIPAQTITTSATVPLPLPIQRF
jgi:hypothetical protein